MPSETVQTLRPYLKSLKPEKLNPKPYTTPDNDLTTAQPLNPQHSSPSEVSGSVGVFLFKNYTLLTKQTVGFGELHDAINIREPYGKVQKRVRQTSIMSIIGGSFSI